MSTQRNVIELNGNKYDAATGRVITTEKKHSAPPHRGRAVDGFIRRPGAASHANKQIHLKAKTAHSVHSKTSKSKTLMRHVVKPPKNETPNSSTVTRQHKNARHHMKIVTSDITVDQNRLRRAKTVKKSSFISRFGNDISLKVSTKVAHLPVKQHPKPIIDSFAGAPPIHINEVNPFEAALQRAVGHEQPPIKRPNLHKRVARKLKLTPKTLNISAGIIVTLVIGSMVAYRSIPSLAVRLASTRSGVNASLPSYAPAGFSLSGPVQYDKGQVSLSYKSNSDERSFRVTQKSSDWNSQSLLQNFVSTNQKAYQTVQDKGKTIYIYEGSNATWVSGGIWYQIEGESALNSDQLLRIANGL